MSKFIRLTSMDDLEFLVNTQHLISVTYQNARRPDYGSSVVIQGEPQPIKVKETFDLIQHLLIGTMKQPLPR